MNKVILTIFAALTFMFAGFFYVDADGMVIQRPDPFSDRWDYADESDQQAFINYQNGLEKMIVSVKTGGNADSVWLFPVPADPAKVVIDVVGELPQMNGQEITAKAKMNLANARDFLFKTQIYPSLFGSAQSAVYDNSLQAPVAGMLKGEAVQMPSDVTVYEHLDKEGMTTELVTAKTADGLFEYFETKGLKIEKGMIPALDSYIGKDYSFVASWMSVPKITDVTGQTNWLLDTSTEGISKNLESWLGISEIDKMVFDLSLRYPQIDAKKDADGGFIVNGGTTLPFLRSDEGRDALEELANAIRSNPNYSGMSVSVDESGAVSSSQPMKEGGVTRGTMPSDIYRPVPSGAKGVSVMFPAPAIYFPLLPTSVYESKTVPATIKVVGYVEPKIYQSIANFTRVSYYADASFYGGAGSVFFSDTDPKKYTKIEIDVPSKYLTEDLWMQSGAPSNIVRASLIAAHPFALSVILLALCSLSAVFIVGPFLLKNLRRRPGTLALVGISNVLSIIGFIVAALFVKTAVPAGKDSELLEKAAQKGYVKKRKTALVLYAVAIVSFLFMTCGSYGMFAGMFSPFSMYFPYRFAGAIAIALLYLPLVLAFLGWRNARVADGDSQLFAELKSKGYSTWTFVQRGDHKLLFIVLFSLLFLAVSWLVTELLKLAL